MKLNVFIVWRGPLFQKLGQFPPLLGIIGPSP